MKKLTFVLISLYILFSFQLLAQRNKKNKNSNSYFGYHLKSPKQKFTRIPIALSSNLIVVKLVIDESDTLNFILDSGVSSTFITDKSIIKNLDFKFTRKVQISGAGEGEAIEANVSNGHTIRIKDVIAENQNIVVLNEDILRLSEYMGMPIHGIFGHDLFDSFVVTIDFENTNLRLFTFPSFKYRKSMGDKFPIVVTQSKPYTDAFSLVENGNPMPLKLVIDTGAGHALMLKASGSKNDMISLPDKYIRANLGRGLNGDINGVVGRVKKMRMGNVELNDVIASFPDSISFSMKFPPTDYDRQGSIGGEMLRRFTVTFNYHEGYMIMKPIKYRLKETFEHDMSGMEVRVKGEKFDKFVIENIIEESPAYKAGLRVGDEILFFNNANASHLNINDIYKQLSQKEGRDIEIFVRRNGELRFFYFTLKRFI